MSQIGLVAVQGSSMQPSICVESWGLLFIFPRVSQKQLLEYQQLLKHCGLLFEIGVQLVVSCTVIEAQVVFEMLLVLITGELAIAGQLRREVHLWSIRLLFRSKGQR